MVLVVSPVTNANSIDYTFHTASFLALLSLVHGPWQAGREENNDEAALLGLQ